jgi:hypothetical protein
VAVSYADFIFASILYMTKLIDEAEFQKFWGLDEAFPKVYEASKKWLRGITQWDCGWDVVYEEIMHRV